MLDKLKELENKERDYLISLNSFENEVKSSEYILSKKRIIKSCNLLISKIDYLSEKIGKQYDERKIYKLDNSKYSNEGRYIKEGYLICFSGKVNMFYYRGNKYKTYYFKGQILERFSYDDLNHIMKNLIKLYNFLAEEYYYVKFEAKTNVEKIDKILEETL